MFGGPSHIDLWDMKPDAPAEIRGPFQPINTNVPGIDLGETMPRTAAIMDKMAIVRSLYGGLNDHNIHINLTGWETHPQMGDSPHRPGFPIGGWPSLGAVVSKVSGPVTPALPAFISLSPPNAESTTRASLNQSGFLGIGHAGFETNRRKRDDIVYKSGVSKEQVAADAESAADITLRGITLDRLGDRKRLLGSFDRFRRESDARGVMDGMDTITQQAFGILTSSKLADALDFRQEPAELLRRYGISDAATPVHGGPELVKQFLVATRLVEAGCRCVTLAFSQWPLERMSRGGFNWDWHKENFLNVRATVPMLDLGLSAMVEDLHARGLADDVSVVVWGEFGRTPDNNRRGGVYALGRGHNIDAMTMLMAGGGVKKGTIIGATDEIGAKASEVVHPIRDLHVTLLHLLGLDDNKLTYFHAGRYKQLSQFGGKVIKELVA